MNEADRKRIEEIRGRWEPENHGSLNDWAVWCAESIPFLLDFLEKQEKWSSKEITRVVKEKRDHVMIKLQQENEALKCTNHQRQGDCECKMCEGWSAGFRVGGQMTETLQKEKEKLKQENERQAREITGFSKDAYERIAEIERLRGEWKTATKAMNFFERACKEEEAKNEKLKKVAQAARECLESGCITIELEEKENLEKAIKEAGYGSN